MLKASGSSPHVTKPGFSWSTRGGTNFGEKCCVVNRCARSDMYLRRYPVGHVGLQLQQDTGDPSEAGYIDKSVNLEAISDNKSCLTPKIQKCQSLSLEPAREPATLLSLGTAGCPCHQARAEGFQALTQTPNPDPKQILRQIRAEANAQWLVRCCNITIRLLRRSLDVFVLSFPAPTK